LSRHQKGLMTNTQWPAKNIEVVNEACINNNNFLFEEYYIQLKILILIINFALKIYCGALRATFVVQGYWVKP